jgi:hypothetical protein
MKPWASTSTIFYYSEKSGLGRHDHDVESAEFKTAVWRRGNCPDCRYALLVIRVIGKALGILWYDNTLEIDPSAKFPMTILVEEGKHASCTDKNGDGYFTPAYDVNRNPNDAWGVRDVMDSGLLFSGRFQSWYAKVRSDEHRVFPALPGDSPLGKLFTKEGRYAPDNAQYSLRPFPSAEKAQPDLIHFIATTANPVLGNPFRRQEYRSLRYQPIDVCRRDRRRDLVGWQLRLS